ncbi:MAG: elongation factor Ts [Clostridiales bacterium]|nr:elongation factor Ts [Clostridiales bacterium]
MAFTAKDVKTLRERTGVGMMDCKKALVEANGDMDKAVEILRERGLAAATKKSGRVAAEGLVASFHDEDAKVSALVEVNSETDFVAKNAEFQSFAADVAKTIAIENPADNDALGKVQLVDSTRTVTESLQDKILTIGENLQIRRFVRVEGLAATYIHAGGSVGVIVSFEADDSLASNETFKAMGKDVAMQIAAMSPQYLDEASVPADVVEYEKGIILTQIKEDPNMANKPEKVLENISRGRMAKLFNDICLLNQPFVKDDSKSVAKYVESVAKELGSDIKVTGFTRFAKGEGLQKREDNFADEVADMMK